MAIYPAFFASDDKGGYAVMFPDLPGCFTEGADEQEAMAMAIDALSGHVHALKDLGRELPAPAQRLRVRHRHRLGGRVRRGLFRHGGTP